MWVKSQESCVKERRGEEMIYFLLAGHRTVGIISGFH